MVHNSSAGESAQALLDFYSEQQRGRYDELRDQLVGVTSVNGGQMHDLRVGPINRQANMKLVTGFVDLLPPAASYGSDWRDTEIVAPDPFIAKQVTASVLWQRHDRKGWLSPHVHTPYYILGRGIGRTAVQRLRAGSDGLQRKQNPTTEVLLASAGGGLLKTVRVFDSELAAALVASGNEAATDYPASEVERMYDQTLDALRVDSHAPGSMIYSYTTGRRLHLLDLDPLGGGPLRRDDTFQTTTPYAAGKVSAKIADKGMHAQPGRQLDPHEITDKDMSGFDVIHGIANLAVAFGVADKTRELLGQYGKTRQPLAAEILTYQQ
jgi:hypothetical protein